jgi:arabinan endo-1,5-alpha-L-arabinosidase
MKNRFNSLFFFFGFAGAIGGVIVARGQRPAEGTADNVPAGADPNEVLRTFGNRGITVHDPSTILKCKDEYWVFATGHNTPSFHSSDLVHWMRGPVAIATPPTWIAQAVPNNRGNSFWAPDVIKVGSRYLLFFAVSTFGKNTSAIGVATNPTLDPADPNYK